MTCPECGATVTHVPEGRQYVAHVPIYCQRTDSPTIKLIPRPFNACDRCEWAEAGSKQ